MGGREVGAQKTGTKAKKWPEGWGRMESGKLKRLQKARHSSRKKRPAGAARLDVKLNIKKKRREKIKRERQKETLVALGGLQKAGGNSQLQKERQNEWEKTKETPGSFNGGLLGVREQHGCNLQAGKTGVLGEDLGHDWGGRDWMARGGSQDTGGERKRQKKYEEIGGCRLVLSPVGNGLGGGEGWVQKRKESKLGPGWGTQMPCRWQFSVSASRGYLVARQGVGPGAPEETLA